MAEVSIDIEEGRGRGLRRVSWGAIFAGVVTIISVQILLALLGIGLGAAAFNPADGAQEAKGIGIGAALWWFISGIIAVYLGGMVAGRLAGVPTRRDGMLHGFVTWGFATIVFFYLLSTTIGGIIGGTASTLGRAVSTTAQVAATGSAASAGQDKSSPNEPSMAQLATDPEVQEMAKRVYQNGGQPNPQDREQLIALVQEKGHMDRAQAESEVSKYEQTVVKAKQQMAEKKEEVKQAVREHGDEAARKISKAALGTFFALLCGAVAGIFGGGSGAPKPMGVVRERRVA